MYNKLKKKNNILIIIALILLILYNSYKNKIYEMFENICIPHKYNVETEPWNNDNHIKFNNCYSYALNEPDSNLKEKRYPGQSSNTKRNESIYTCEYYEQLLKSDNPHIVKTNNFNECPCDKPYHMISMVIADNTTPYEEDDGDDFHFYRLDNNNKWSHKPGSRKVSYIDANNKEVIDPAYAEHNYSLIDGESKNYNNFCGYYCI